MGSGAPPRHKIAKSILRKYFKESQIEMTLATEDIIKLLRLDGASFSTKRIRLYDPDDNAFVKLEQDFILKIDEAQRNENMDPNRTLILCLERKVTKNQRRLASLSSRVRKIEKKLKLVPVDKNASSPRSLNETIGDSDALEGIESRLLDPEHRKKLLSQLSLHEDSNNLFGISNRKLDIAIMNAEPLVEIRNSTNIISLPDSVDYEEECREIHATLMDKGVQIQLIFEIATRTNLVNVLSRNPTILHIMCHGEYDKEKDQFYLCFEKTTGEIDQLYAEDLKEIVNKFETTVQLVFVNACHSEPVARVFSEAGVPFVIAVQSQLQISDIFAKRFAQSFYDFIFDGRTVKEAFNLARIASADPLSYSCCCAHAHKLDCKWQKHARQVGYHQAHTYHNSTCTLCVKKRENLHSLTCHWAREFFEAYEIEREPDPVTEYISSCCCSPELPHNELLKFIMISRDKHKCDSLVLFENLQPGKVQNCKIYNIIDQRFPEKRLIGRNRQLYELYTALRLQQKVVKLEGPPGSGKTALARQLANYLFGRNRFRYKIAVIDLRRIRSVSAFLAKIFSEIELVTDINTFCEAVRTKEVLYILENCDSFLQDNKIEFAEILQNLISSTRCVKFLLIVGKSVDLELQEACIKLGSLPPLHAAKLLLLNTPIEKIFPTKYRSVEELKNTELFQKYSEQISIQTLWWISQRLIKGEKFGLIEAELISKLQASTSQTDSAILVDSTIKQIRATDTSGYRLILQICSFCGGVSYTDLEDMFRDTSFDWKSVLSNLLSQNSAKETYLQCLNELELPNLELKHSKSQQRKLRNRSAFFSSTFHPGRYFWLDIVNPKDEELIFQPAEVIRSVIYEKPESEVLDAEMEKFEYLTMISLSMLDNLQKIHAYSEKMLENSAICQHGIWKIDHYNPIFTKYVTRKPSVKPFSEQGAMTLRHLQYMFDRHDINLRSCLNLEIIKRIIAEEERHQKRLIYIIEILWFTIPTLYKIFSKDLEVASYLASKALNNLSELQIKSENISLLKIKLHLFLIGMTIHRTDQAKAAQQVVNSEMDLIELCKSEISTREVLQLIDFEMLFSKVYFYRHNGECHSIPKDIIEDETFDRSEFMLSVLENKCEIILKNFEGNSAFERAKVVVMICELRIKLKKLSEKFKDRLLEAVKIFRNSERPKLQVRAQICLARLFLEIFLEKRKIGIEKDKQIDESSFLEDIRKNQLKKSALCAANLLNDTKSTLKIHQLINTLNAEVRRKLFNMMIFLHANPLRLPPNINFSPELDKRMIMIPNFFKSDLIDILSEKNKVLNLKFDVLTAKSLKASAHMGCRILYISSEMISEDGIIVEDEQFRPQLITFEELKDIFGKKSRKRSSVNDEGSLKKYKLELVIIGSRNDSKLANWLGKELEIPHIICFEFNQLTDTDFKRKIYQTEYINKFVQILLNNLLDNRTLEDSFNSAIKDTLHGLSYSFFNQEEDNKITEFLGKGAILLPNTENKEEKNLHGKPLFGYGEFILQKGKVEDISLQRFSATIFKSIVPFFGRAKEINQIIDYLTQDPSGLDGFLKIDGDEGVGKSRLVLEVAWYLAQRNVFPNGVFYLPLVKVNKMNVFNLIETAAQKFGVAMGKNYANFFRGKKMVLIFDDFHVFYPGDIAIPDLLLSIIKKSKIPVIVICKKFNVKESLDEANQETLKQFQETQSDIESRYIIKTQTLQRMSSHHIANIMISLTSTAHHGLSHQEALDHPVISKIRGVPSRVIEFLNNGKLLHRGVVLEMLPYYIPFQMLNKRYRHYFKKGKDLPELDQKERRIDLFISRHAPSFKTEARKFVKMPSGPSDSPDSIITIKLNHSNSETNSDKSSGFKKVKDKRPSFARLPTSIDDDDIKADSAYEPALITRANTQY